MNNIITFQQYLQSDQSEHLWSADEVIEFILPLFEEVLSFHENGQVASFERTDTIFINNGRLDIDENFSHEPVNNLHEVLKLLAKDQIAGFSITERITLDEDLSANQSSSTNHQIQNNPNEVPTHPVYILGYQCFEIKLGHHDVQTDIFCLGLILGSVVMGLDLYDADDLNQFVAYRNQPAGVNVRMHPTICALITEMTELNRKTRSKDMKEIIQRLKFYRDYDPQKETDLSKLAAFQIKIPSDRKTFILSKLRNRLFDSSRRNRLLYYKPNGRFANLTVSSVPVVLHYQSINPQLLFTWNKEISQQVIKQSDIVLNKYLRFEDHPYLNTQLNAIRLSAENDKKEYGFSQLKLVVAFLHWHNLKEGVNERIQSPLLLLPVELERKKSLREERYTLKIVDNAALINPILANHLKDLYGITLPESIDFDDVTMEQFYAMLNDKINSAKQGVKLNYIDKPRIKIIHNIARQTINNYKKKLKLKRNPTIHQMDYSYSEENFKPLGLELFKHKIEINKSAVEFLINDTKPVKTSENYSGNETTSVKDSFVIADGENNPYSWDFDICNIVLGNFNYKKMSLVSDYNKITDENIQHKVFNDLFTNEPKKFEETTLRNDPAEWYHVISADPTQARSVLHSRTGKSYIIQGPPGTGKSQTITNLIADFLGKGKTILFVCEKRAALDVVYYRLQQNRLSELCCYIHDSQADKKKFVQDLKVIYDDFLKNKMDLSAIVVQRNYVLAQLLKNLDVLQTYHKNQTTIYSEAGVSTRHLFEKLLELKEIIKPDNISTDSIPNYDQWMKYGEVIQQLSTALETSGAEPEFHYHPFGNLGIDILKAENPFTLLENLASDAQIKIQQCLKVILENNIPHNHTSEWKFIKNLVVDSVVLEPLARNNNLCLVDISNKEAKEFEEQYKNYKDVLGEYRQALEINKRWQNKLEKQEVEVAISLAEKFEKSFFGFLNGKWRRLKNQLNRSYDFSSHQIRPEYTVILGQLLEEYKINERAIECKHTIERKYHFDNLDTAYLSMEVLRSKQGDKEIDFLLQHPQADTVVIQLSKLNATLRQLELHLKQCLYRFESRSLQQINDDLATIQSNAHILKDLLPSLRRFVDLPLNIQDFIRNIPISAIQAEFIMAEKTLELLLDKNRSFAGTTQSIIHDTVQNLEKDYKELLHLNSNYIRAVRREKFIKNYELSNKSVTVLTPEQRQVKKEYTEGRKILEHEMSKSMRYKSIREIASGDSGKVLKDIKPVWLMSPLSVSDSLPLDTTFFDVVIFDEASQITLEEGIPALFRASQTIIVGDDKQMPPSNFFSSKAEDPEDLEIIDGENSDEILSADTDSLLVQGSRKLNSTMLSWHYRSRYETLISYSNHAFYDAGLLTIPDKLVHHRHKPLLQIQNVEEGADNAKQLMNGSISFHYLPNSVYENRNNVSEAKYIAHLVRKLLKDEIKETIGIVAFSQEQQSVIEEEIDNLAATDKLFEELLEKAYNRKDEEQFTGLFIKNLENVQGDERDFIIMSVCYGHDSNKKMLMNFGPINKKGGEKRLNVIFSRAKRHMAVVSSIQHHHITNEYNDGANYFKRFLQYAEMVSTGNMSGARLILDNLMPENKGRTDIKTKESALAFQIKTALEANGFFVDDQIGQSNFKCNLGIKKSSDDLNYCLGILIDDDMHYSNDDLMEQYYQRPSILHAFGWEIVNVFAKDWLEDKDRVLQMILRKLGHDSAEIKANPIIKLAQSENNNKFEYITLMSASGDKFWEVTQVNEKLHIRAGKTNTKGLIQIKTFLNEMEAEVVKNNLIAEQINLGYNYL